MERMQSLKILLFLTPLACLFGQAPPPAAPAAANKPPTVSLSTEPAPAPAAVPPDKVVLTIGDEKMTAAQFDKFIEMIPPQYRAQMHTPQGRRNLADNIVRLKVLAQEARKNKLDQTPEFNDQLERQKENLLFQAEYKELVGAVKVDDATARAYYEQHKPDYEQFKGSDILVRVKGSPIALRAGQKELSDEEALAKAKELRAKLVGGANFADLAKAESDDSTTSATGGSLGMFAHGRLPQPAEDAIQTLKVGEISEPIKTPNGYYLIKLEERHQKTFEEAQGDIERRLKPEAINKAMQQLQTAANVTMDEDFFGKPMPPKAVAPAPAGAPAVKPIPPPAK
jgi:peptidyl-prolyl cis-trans isomerase C